MVGVYLYSFNIDLWFTPSVKAYKIYVRNYEHFSSSASQCNFSKYVYVWKEKMDLILLICNFLNEAEIKLASPIIKWCCIPGVNSINRSSYYLLEPRVKPDIHVQFGKRVRDDRVKLYANKIFGNCFITHNICKYDLIWFIRVLVGKFQNGIVPCLRPYAIYWPYIYHI